MKTELFNDHFQNYKRYHIPKAQLVIADIPYNLGNNAYASKQAEAQSCAASLSLQNAAIKSLQIKASGLNEDKIKSVSKIYIKDRSCESELRAYKMLFDSAF